MKKILLTLTLVAIIASASLAANIIGVENGTPYMRFNMGNSQALDIGAGYSSLNSGATTNLTVWGRLNNSLAKYGDIATSWGATLGLINTAGGTTIQLTGLVSASYEIAKNILIYGNINLVTLQTGNNNTSFWLLNADNNAYSGIRIYLP